MDLNDVYDRVKKKHGKRMSSLWDPDAKIESKPKKPQSDKPTSAPEK